ncbi:ABC transporter ATP-binding protein [Flavobacteriaceae bacterium]|nr:ABC transporter ATP-binding protein [Flavobacteriaceae bacterium]
MSLDIILKVNNVGKQYRLGIVGTGTISHDLNRWWSRIIGKEDPYLKVGEANVRSEKGSSDYVWAIRNINFEVKRGEVLGIIGKNGAGKSTLLKILSRVTSPTTGEIKTKGRIASLLEVGTGFHPEMTGRENIFLNGAILGMTKAEINSKIDEIIDFSGCLRYVDTPVKRYSSGMKVRLAFAVAVHLEPDILVVDEVLAVGDAEFQKKAIGKMQNISNNQGRTVLFVSHNMATINKLCKRSILLQNGEIFKEGPTSEIIPFYLSSGDLDDMICNVEFDNNEAKKLQIISADISSSNNQLIKQGVITTDDDLFIKIAYKFRSKIPKCHLTIIIKNDSGEIIYFADRTDFYNNFFSADIGQYQAKVKIPNPLLKPGTYFITLGLADQFSNADDHKFDVLKFKIENLKSIRKSREGDLFVPLEWEMKKLD